MMKLLVLFALLIAGGPLKSNGAGTDTLSLIYCYERIRDHYPLARKIELQQEITDLQVRLANTGLYPQIELGGTASYQSEVTRVPAGPGGTGPPALSKDQYRVSLEVNQPIYSGGSVGIRKKLEQAQGRQEQISTEVQLQELRSQVDEVYFGILLARQQSRTIELLIDNLQRQLKTVKAQVENGVLLRSQQYVLEAELLKVQQDSSAIQSNIRAGIRVLGELIGEDLDVSTTLALPGVSQEDLRDADTQRPEYKLFQSSKSLLEFQKRLTDSKKLPTISAFGNLSYGRPGYNFFNNEFHEFYMIGARIRWSFWDWNNSAEEARIIAVQQRKIDEDRLAFDRQLSSALSRIEEQIASLQEQIEQDKQIIALRQKVINESESQLKNGVLTATEYVTELNRVNEAQLALYAHRVQLAQMIMQFATTKGISINRLTQSAKTSYEGQ